MPGPWHIKGGFIVHHIWIGYIAAAVPLVPEPVPAIGPANDGADYNVGVGALADEPVVEPLRAANR